MSRSGGAPLAPRNLLLPERDQRIDLATSFLGGMGGLAPEELRGNLEADGADVTGLVLTHQALGVALHLVF